MKFSKLGLVLAVGMVMTVLSALATGAAQAEENKGPLWIVGSPARGLLAGQTRAFDATSGVAELHSSASGVPNTVCEKTLARGFLLGGSPGTDDATITFRGCHAAGKPNCVATGVAAGTNEEEIVVSVLTILAFANGSRTSAVDLYAPEGESGAEELFVAYKLKNRSGFTECGTLAGEIKAEAKGSPVTINGKTRNLGQLAKIGHEASGVFTLSTVGETANVGLLEFPERNGSEHFNEAELYNSSSGKYEKVTALLEAGALKEAWQTTTTPAVILLSPKEPFGWDY
ncbi:MAG TPA: hypothetical protein VG147_15085 [Solirubrobacteraceae bacterium]|jgi:hypothetical protein|nr:hypothetical protein [Solirubrobacteraceae bacterium]